MQKKNSIWTRNKLITSVVSLSAALLFSNSVVADPIWTPVQSYQNHANSYYAPDQQFAGFNEEMIAPLIGAAVGGLIGSQIGGGKGKLAATAAGTVIGYVLGGKVRDYMDRGDRYQTHQALEYSRNYKTTAWLNPDTQARYQVTPVATYQNANGVCRDYVTHAIIDGRSEEITGTACRTANGNWRVK